MLLSLSLHFYLLYYRHACAQRSHLSITFTQWSKSGFRPAGATHCPDKREIWRVRTDRRSSPHIKYHVYQSRNVGVGIHGNTSPKLSKFGISAINLPLRGDSFAQFLHNSRRLYASIGSF